MPAEIDGLWKQGAAWLEAAGAKVVEISLPMTKYALATYYIIAPAEASANLARYDGVRFGLRVPGNTLDEMYENTRAEGFGKEVQRRLLMGTYVLSDGYYDAYYLKAQRVRALIAADFARAFADVDVIPLRLHRRPRSQSARKWMIRSPCISTTCSPCRLIWPACLRFQCRPGCHVTVYRSDCR